MKSLLSSHIAFKKHILAGLRNYGLKPGQPNIMFYISSHQGCQQKDIAENCYVESGTLTSVLANMEKNNLIERRQNTDDKRAYSIYPLEDARPLYDAVENQFNKTMEIALSGFSEKEVDEFRTYLNRMEKNLKAIK